ncbi:MAG: acylphosphatase, partial [Sutterella sp.]|nr:acylphosphatase [Sutterella sp.]
MPETPQMIRQLVRVTGLVQGVGFRPTVYRVALERHLTGFVFNDAAGVGIEIEGEREAVLGFEAVLRAAKPPLARIDTVLSREIPLKGDPSFTIHESEAG